MQDNGPLVELGMQELEPMDALGWWTGFQEGVKITIATLVFSAATAAT
ncbi:hypothetical protein SAMN05216184_11077 [Georgenia satyanarayanai]|uniref:Uncharacterized protein n=1 Tax=Georgenia satyanarayanai TaxID=860221 RepID=A0A2Y9AL72_9MICO|nr:daptide-type RiPP [Georgenia satyanarayanai]PYF98938.1 hypothetical protein A8987_11077 [Georgenia satyanarayanai]SSA44786.1 hypothetical protein SAMN05216184_11077 [Georgenia satyanarayanai]